MPVADDARPGSAVRAAGLYDAVRARVQLEYDLWIRQGWRRNDPDHPYHRQAQLDAARAGIPITLCASLLQHDLACIVREQLGVDAMDMFDRVIVSPDAAVRFAGTDVNAWCAEQGL